MTKTTTLSAQAVFALGLIAALSGCGGGSGRLVTVEPPDQNSGGIYETLWVEPRILVADSMITLIRSDRIDSALIKPSERGIERPSAVEVRIPEGSCNVTVDLLDANLRLIRPLIVKNLAAGFYRLTLNADRFREPSLRPGRYFLRAQYCGRTELAMFSRP